MSVVKETLDIDGMTCASCVSSVEKSLGALNGVLVASVNLATETASVEYDQDRIDIAELMQAVEDVGYSALAKNER